MSTPPAERPRAPVNTTVHRDVWTAIDGAVARGEARSRSEWIEQVACRLLGVTVPPRPNDAAKARKRAKATS